MTKIKVKKKVSFVLSKEEKDKRLKMLKYAKKNSQNNSKSKEAFSGVSDVLKKAKKAKKSQPAKDQSVGERASKTTEKNQLWCWSFNFPADECSPSQLSQHFKIFCKNFSFQLEKGEENGHLHYQCCISLIQKDYYAGVKNRLPSSTFLQGTKSYFTGFNYAVKPETRVGGPWTEKSVFLNIIEKLRPWQQNVLNLITKYKNNDRKILWFGDIKGKSGKTVFTKYLIQTLKFTCVSSAKEKDIAYALEDNPAGIIFHCTRSLENKFNYGALEACKDGLIFSAKYESKLKLFNPPTVIVFANFFPNIKTLTEDKWKIYDVEKMINKLNLLKELNRYFNIKKLRRLIIFELKYFIKAEHCNNMILPLYPY